MKLEDVRPGRYKWADAGLAERQSYQYVTVFDGPSRGYGEGQFCDFRTNGNEAIPLADAGGTFEGPIQ